VPAALVGLPVAFIISHVILQRPFVALPTKEKQPTAPTARIEKIKREDDVGALLSLLDEDDADDLRQRIKSRLLDRIDAGSGEEVESFEALLEARDRQKRR
jgi:hypothetical protein